MQFIIKATELARDSELYFRYNILVAIISAAISFITVWISATIPARKIAKVSVMDAIFYRDDTKVKKMKKFMIFSKIFGIEGEIARKSIYSRKKSFRTATRAFICSSLALITFLNFETVSDLSTNKTFFERYRDKWDIMFQMPDMNNRNELTQEIRDMDGIKECINYKKCAFYTEIDSTYFSNELNVAGGLDVISENITENENGKYQIGIPIIILDDVSFDEYYNSLQNNNGSNLSAQEKCVAINKIWKSKNHNLKGEYIPYLKEIDNLKLEIFEKNNESQKYTIYITNYAQELPNLKEEYNRYECELVLIISESYANKINSNMMNNPTYFNVKINNISEIYDIQNKIEQKITGIEYQIQNRIQEETSDKNIRSGLRIIIWTLAGILALIGIVNVFSNCISQISLRKREFARYMSIGLSRKGIKKILTYEALIISLKPIIISLIINVPIVLLFLNASQILLSDYINNMPIIPILCYIIFILLAVSIAYYIGGKKILNKNIVDMLKDDTLY